MHERDFKVNEFISQTFKGDLDSLRSYSVTAGGSRRVNRLGWYGCFCDIGLPAAGGYTVKRPRSHFNDFFCWWKSRTRSISWVNSPPHWRIRNKWLFYRRNRQRQRCCKCVFSLMQPWLWCYTLGWLWTGLIALRRADYLWFLVLVYLIKQQCALRLKLLQKFTKNRQNVTSKAALWL